MANAISLACNNDILCLTEKWLTAETKSEKLFYQSLKSTDVIDHLKLPDETWRGFNCHQKTLKTSACTLSQLLNKFQ